MSEVVLILGEDRLLTREAAEEILAKHPHLERVRLRGEETSVAAVLDEVRTPTLLGERRAVVVEAAGPVFEDGGLDAFATYAEKPVQGTLLLLMANSLDGRLKAAKALRASAKVIQCSPPPPWKMAEWVAARAHDLHGLVVAPDAAAALVKRLGEETALLDGALARLKTQIGDRDRLTVADVVGSTGEHRSPILFEAGNAVEDRDLGKALDAVRAAFSEGLKLRAEAVTDPGGVAPILVSNMHGAWSKLLRFQFALRAGAAEADAARQAGVSPKAAKFFLRRAHKHRFDELLARHSAFLRADSALKRSAAPPRMVVERLVLDLLS